MPDNTPRNGHAPSRPSHRRLPPDAYGQAALLLAESILHTLVEAGALTLDQAIGAARTAAEVKVDVAAELEESDARMEHSISLLNAIERSLRLQDYNMGPHAHRDGGTD